MSLFFNGILEVVYLVAQALHLRFKFVYALLLAFDACEQIKQIVGLCVFTFAARLPAETTT